MLGEVSVLPSTRLMCVLLISSFNVFLLRTSAPFFCLLQQTISKVLWDLEFGIVFFFFKQKTAYEMIWSLEFRRVLFRSLAALHDGRRRRGERQVPLGQRQVSLDDRAFRRLPRRAILRDLRRLRLHHEGAHGGAARVRPRDLALQRVAAASRPGDASGTHGSPLREHHGGREVPARPSQPFLGELSRLSPQPPYT